MLLELYYKIIIGHSMEYLIIFSFAHKKEQCVLNSGDWISLFNLENEPTIHITCLQNILLPEASVHNCCRKALAIVDLPVTPSCEHTNSYAGRSFGKASAPHTLFCTGCSEQLSSSTGNSGNRIPAWFCKSWPWRWNVTWVQICWGLSVCGCGTPGHFLLFACSATLLGSAVSVWCCQGRGPGPHSAELAEAHPPVLQGWLTRSKDHYAQNQSQCTH